ncbi:MAG: 16S rRNA (guanine(966)-N(2))-methyltransferase RsmD [Pseudomonadota bacterium]
MRIVAGKYGGQRLFVPKNRDIRPTSDKVRGAIFNALEARGAVQGARVLDCFCGTGALGLEALSRGAAHCTFWDKDKASLALAKRNTEHLGAMGESAFQIRDAVKSFEAQGDDKYDLIFLDPPYRKDMISAAVKALEESLVFEKDTTLIVEAEKDCEPQLGGSFKMQSHKVYGDSAVYIFSKI